MEKLYKYTCIFNIDKATSNFTCEENDVIISENKQIVYKDKNGYFGILNLFEYKSKDLKKFENKLGEVKIKFSSYTAIMAELYSLNKVENYEDVLTKEVKKYLGRVL